MHENSCWFQIPQVTFVLDQKEIEGFQVFVGEVEVIYFLGEGIDRTGLY